MVPGRAVGEPAFRDECDGETAEFDSDAPKLDTGATAGKLAPSRKETKARLKAVRGIPTLRDASPFGNKFFPI
jgi:hypothetical protein